MRLGNDAARMTSWLAAPVFAAVPTVTLGDLMYAATVGASIVAAGWDALGWGAGWSEPFFAQSPGERPLLLARAVALGVAIVRVRPADRARAEALALVAALLLVSLVARGLWIPAALAIGLVVHRFAERSDAPAPPWVTVAALVLPCALLALRRPPASVADAPPVGPPSAQIDSWRARGNPYRAHAVALAWATQEATPGEGHLALAEIDHALGDDGKARKVLEKVLAAPASAAVRDRAAAHEREWAHP